MKKIMMIGFASVCAMFMAGCASSAQKAAEGGYKTEEENPATELESIKQDMEKKDIPCGIGIATSNDQMVARSQSEDEARTQIAESMKTMIQRYKEQYAKNISAEAQKIWEEKSTALTQQEVSGSTVYKTITQFNEAEGKYQIYSLMIMNPTLFKKAIDAATADQQEFALRAESADMQKRMDKAIEEYKTNFSK